jgi:hypothetical protein
MSASINPDAVPDRSAGMAWQTIEGEMILLNIPGKELMGLNEVAARIWSLIDGTRSIARIAEAVAAEFDVSAEEAHRDVIDFVAELNELGALSWRG